MNQKKFRIDDEFNRLLKIFCANANQTEQEVVARAVWEYIHRQAK